MKKITSFKTLSPGHRGSTPFVPTTLIIHDVLLHFKFPCTVSMHLRGLHALPHLLMTIHLQTLQDVIGPGAPGIDPICAHNTRRIPALLHLSFVL